MKTIIISAGGSGGHIFPALAVAKELQVEYRIIWVGGKIGLENQIVPKHGFYLTNIAVAGVRNNGLCRKICLPLVLVRAMCSCWWLILRYRPVAVIGFGGYATFPICLLAKLMFVPMLIHEQNSVAGLSNKVLAKLATRVLTAFPGVLASPKTKMVGNPIRAEIVNLERVPRLAPEGSLRILIVGGSLGAKALNDTLPLALSLIPEHIQSVVHQVGRGSCTLVQQVYDQYHIPAQVVSFIEDMAAAYAQADLIICRAGASTVAEITLAGLAAVFVPYPFAVDDHQTKNAKYLAEQGAAYLIPQAELTPQSLAKLIAGLTPMICQETAAKAANLAIHDSSARICAEIKASLN